MSNTNKAYLFERTIVAIADELGKEQGMNFTELAHRAFGATQSSVVKWRKIRREEKPQNLTASDIMLLAEALGMDASSLVFRAQEMLKMKG